MGRYLIRRLLFFILVLFIVSLLTFIIFVKLPSVDPAIRAAGRHPSAALLAAIRHKFGLDQPLYVQYWNFAKGLIPWPGLFLNKQVYFSYGSHVPVMEEMKSRIPVTLMLTIGASILWLAMGIPIGIISAIRPPDGHRPRRHAVRAVRGVGARRSGSAWSCSTSSGSSSAGFPRAGYPPTKRSYRRPCTGRSSCPGSS